MILAVSERAGRVVSLPEAEKLSLYDVQAGSFTPCGTLSAAGGMGGLLMTLMGGGVNALLTYALSPDTRAMLNDMGIPAFGAGEGSCEDAVRRFLAGELAYTAPASCGGDCSGCSGCGH